MLFQDLSVRLCHKESSFTFEDREKIPVMAGPMILLFLTFNENTVHLNLANFQVNIESPRIFQQEIPLLSILKNETNDERPLSKHGSHPQPYCINKSHMNGLKLKSYIP